MIERDEPSLELRLRRMSQQPEYGCNCDHPDADNVKRHPWEHSTNCRWRILVEAAEECAEAEMLSGLSDRLDHLLRGTVNTLRGEPPPLVHWSHHDIPELAGLYRAVYVAAVQFIGATGWQGKAGTAEYAAFHSLVKATETVADNLRADYESIREALKEGGDDAA